MLSPLRQRGAFSNEAGTLTAGDRGAVIVIDAGGYNLTGSTCTLLAAPGRFNTMGNSVPLTPVIVTAGGLTATYTQTGNDFTEGGPWMLQLQIITPDGSLFKSPPRPIYVFPRLS